MRIFVMLVALAFVPGPVLAKDVTASHVVHISRDEILSDPAMLPDEGYLSTGQPDEAVLRSIAEAGFVAVIDLRTADEDRGIDEKAEAEALGLSYISLPVAGSDGINYENAEELDRLLTEFDGPVLLHCGSGNRVGALFALREKLHGASDEDALAVGQAAGLTRSEKTVEERLQEK